MKQKTRHCEKVRHCEARSNPDNHFIIEGPEFMFRMTRNLFAFLLATLFLLVSCNKSSDWNPEKGSGGTTIIETGTLEAINNVQFVIPRYSMYLGSLRILGFVENGTLINAGDSIVQLDPADVNKMIIDRKTSLDTQVANFEKMRVEQSNKISELESKIRNETAAFNLKKIELDASIFDTERQRSIKQLEFKQAEITLEKEKRKLELAEIVHANDLKIQQIRVQQLENNLEQFVNILSQLTLRSTVAGVFQRGRNPSNLQPYNLGDIAYYGFSVGNVPEFKWMKVTTFINENDFLKILVGQKVNVRLDASPELTFTGEVSYVGKLCRLKEQNSKQKGFDVEVKMMEPDERLKPGMTVSCEFLIN